MSPILGWKKVDFNHSIVSGNPESPNGLLHYVFGMQDDDGPFLGVTLQLPMYHRMEEFDFEERYEAGHVGEPEYCGTVEPVFYITDAEEICYRWTPVDHERFEGLRLPEYVDADTMESVPKPTIHITVRQMTTPEYETLVAFDQAGPRNEWMDTEFVTWRIGSK